jgi:hypothetical protein
LATLPKHKNFASSAESVGGYELWNLPKLMIPGGLQRFMRLEAVGLLNGRYRFVVHPVDTAILNDSTIVEPFQQCLARGEDAY